ncbi:hypothetical protein DPEC_G00088250 [Dallia pectoralis]|uniref:Uncharacterized protein n=1 Tax=Dallia pectoralis TaxID=75939 RepID=A0ACC2H0E6_DALPE|nr:hypothetical protein DPEC_G00088250 [Dallia pectoralis]
MGREKQSDRRSPPEYRIPALLLLHFWGGRRAREPGGGCLSDSESLFCLGSAVCLLGWHIPAPEGKITMATALCHACLWMFLLLQCRARRPEALLWQLVRDDEHPAPHGRPRVMTMAY